MTIKLHPAQSIVYKGLFIEKRHRFAVVNCSRGWGKSYLAATAAVTAIFELLELLERIPNKTVYIIAPTYDQVKDIYYPLLNYDLGMEHYAIKSSRDQGRFWFPGNVELRLLSYESAERMRGKGAYFVVWDEVSSCTSGLGPKDMWESVVMPAIKTRWSNKRAITYGAKSPGRALIIGTPRGYNYFHEMYNFRDADPKNWGSYTFDYTSSPFLDPEEIEADRANMDPIKFASEYLASFKESGNSLFYPFNRDLHICANLNDFRKPENGDPGEDVHVNIDFNVGLQCSSVMAIRGKEVEILDEFKGHPDTETLAVAIATKYKGHKIYAYPDPSGRARKSSAPVGRTDFSILESHGIRCLARPKAPPIVDSVAAVNRMLLNANNRVSLRVHPRCKGVIQSLERTKWVDGNPDTATIDKSEGVEHFTDGIRYGIEFCFPVTSGVKRVSRGFTF